MIYVSRDKTTGKPQGTAEIDDPKVLADWRQKLIMEKVDDSFRGKNSFEIVFENGKSRHATQQEIDAHWQKHDQDKKVAHRHQLLDDLGLTEAHLDKIRAL